MRYNFWHSFALTLKRAKNANVMHSSWTCIKVMGRVQMNNVSVGFFALYSYIAWLSGNEWALSAPQCNRRQLQTVRTTAAFPPKLHGNSLDAKEN